MAFLCPSRLGRRKQKKGYYSNTMVRSNDLTRLGTGAKNDRTTESRGISMQNFSIAFCYYSNIMVRSNGSESLDVLARLETDAKNGRTAESRRIIMQNFSTADPDELTVKQGQKVTFIFREGDWAYVATDDDKEGFVPFIYCAKLGPNPANSAPAGALRNTFEYPKSAVIKPSNRALFASANTNGIDKPDSGPLNHTPTSTNSFNDDNDSVFESDTHLESVASTPRSDIDIVRDFFGSDSYQKLPKYLDSYETLGAVDTGHICSADPSHQCRERADVGQGTPKQCDGLISDDCEEETAKAEPEAATEDIAALEMCIVLYNYEGSGPDDISAEAGDIVCVMDGSDPFWLLVQTEDRAEGYIPKYYLQKVGPESISPRSPTSSLNSANASIEQAVSRRTSSASSLDTTTAATFDYTDDPVVVPSNTQFVKINISEKVTGDTHLRPGSTDGKQTPVKPPRTNKPKNTKPPIEQTFLKPKRIASDTDDDDYTITVDIESPRSDGSLESLSESMRLELIHSELEKLAPLNKRDPINSSLRLRDSMCNSMSSADSVFDIDVHRQLDQLRPTSAPPYKHYKYEREKAEYYDEYFYDDPEPKIKNSEKEEVINVSEILEIRDALRKVKEDERKAKLNPKTRQNANIAASLRHYMLNLPSTRIGFDPSKNARRNSKDGKGTRRYYISQVEEDNESALYSRPVKAKHRHDKENNDTGSKTQTDDTKVATTHVTTTNAATTKVATTKVATKRTRSGTNIDKNTRQIDKNTNSKTNTPQNPTKRDWSFGYPRKGKDGIQEQNKELNDLNKPHRDHTSGNSVTSDILQDDDMNALLEQSGELLNQSKQLLTTRTRSRTANPPYQSNIENDEHRNIEFSNVTEKCNHYLTNLILSGTGIKNMPGDESNEHTEDENENVSNNDQDEHIKENTPNSPNIDENANTKLAHGECVRNDGENHHRYAQTHHAELVSDIDNGKENTSLPSPTCDDIRGITEFVVQWEYTPPADMETAIPVVRGEVLHIGLDQQEDPEWYWAYSPRLRAYGYVPKLYVRIPMVTII